MGNSALGHLDHYGLLCCRANIFLLCCFVLYWGASLFIKIALLQLCFDFAVSLLWRRCCFAVVLFVYGLAVFVGSACLVCLVYFAYLLCALCLRCWLCWLACFVRFVILCTLSFLSSSCALLASDSGFEMALTKASVLFRHPALSCSSHAPQALLHGSWCLARPAGFFVQNQTGSS